MYTHTPELERGLLVDDNNPILDDLGERKERAGLGSERGKVARESLHFSIYEFRG